MPHLAFAAPREVIDERPSDFVDALSVEPGLTVDMIYFGADNFVGRPIAGYAENRCLLLRAAANALKKAQARLVREAERRGKKYTLLLRDCYRPQKATEDFLGWVQDGQDLKQKEKFYPEIEKSEIVESGYLSAFSAHSRGATVDLTIGERSAGGAIVALDMGSPLDFFGPVSKTNSVEVDAAETETLK
ncbi:MAG: D-alanyl-D-alanine dipeptidase, partial [Proteobacteria bacterium]